MTFFLGMEGERVNKIWEVPRKEDYVCSKGLTSQSNKFIATITDLYGIAIFDYGVLKLSC